MTIEIVLNMELFLIHSKTGKEIVLSDKIEKKWDENSTEYKELCRQFEENTGMKRESNKNLFDEKLVGSLAEVVKKESKASITKLMNVVKQVYLKKGLTACIEFGGAVINPRDFSLVKIKRFDSSFKKC